MIDSLNVANRLLNLAQAKGDSMTPMQVIKLVYLAHGWTLGLLGRPLIKDDVQAWQYGPVVPRLYSAMRNYRSQPVQGPLHGAAPAEIPAPEQSIIDQVYAIYGHLSGPALSRLTHVPGSPWHTVYKPGSFGIVIPNDIIEDYYQRQAAQGQRA